jgi:uncharacterized phage protein (TIGR01671 family)
MREIKFRAWDKRLDEMFYIENMFNMSDKFAEQGKLGYLDLMQFTGLKDKNGKEIYEGDIVKILHGEWMSKPESDNRTLDEYLDSLTKKYEVVFIEGQFLGKRNTGSYNPLSTDNEGNTYTKLKPEKHGFIEIIGNIYENPELLN